MSVRIRRTASGFISKLGSMSSSDVGRISSPIDSFRIGLTITLTADGASAYGSPWLKDLDVGMKHF